MCLRPLLAGAAVTLALASSAGAASEPPIPPLLQLSVLPLSTTPGGVADTAFDLFTVPLIRTAALTFYVPAGYGVDLSAAPGTRIGSADLFFARAPGEVEGAGSVIVDDPSLHTADACAPGTHAAVWVVSLFVNDEQLYLPVYVDPAPPELASSVSYELKTCFDATNAVGLTLEELVFELPHTFTNPSQDGMYLWRAVLSSYDDTGAVDPTAAAELQSLVTFPQTLTVHTSRNARKHTVTLSGAVRSEGRTPRAGVRVHVEAAAVPNVDALKPFASATTDRRGRFSITRPLRHTIYFAAFVDFGDRSTCAPAIGAAACVDETIAPPPPVFGVVRVAKER